MHDGPISSYDEDMKKRNARMSSMFKAAEKKSSSRLLEEAGKQYEKKDVDREKMSMLSDLYYKLCEAIREGEMEPHAAIKDFASGAMAIFGMAHKDKDNSSEEKSEKRMSYS